MDQFSRKAAWDSSMGQARRAATVQQEIDESGTQDSKSKIKGKLDSKKHNANSSGNVSPAQQEKWEQHLHRLHQAALVGEVAAKAFGNKDLAEAFSEVGHGAKGALREGRGAGPGAGRHVASNVLGSSLARSLAKRGKNKEKYGLSKGKSQFVGGAAAAALAGGSKFDMAANGISWYLVDTAFASLFTVVGFVPALMYLDFHYIMSKFHIKPFTEMFIWQKLAVLLANILFGVLLLILLILLFAIYYYIIHPIEVVVS